MQPESATLGDYIDIFRRRKAPMLSVITVLSLVAMMVAVSLPSVYRSTATIRIEQQGIPDDIVRTTVNTYAHADREHQTASRYRRQSCQDRNGAGFSRSARASRLPRCLGRRDD